LKQSASATVNYANVTRSDGAALTTSGTITHLSRYLIRDNNLTDLINAGTSRTNLGLGTLATLNSVDLSGSQATGILAAARFPALTGDVTTSSGSVATSYNNAVPTAKGGVKTGGTTGQV